MHNRDLLHMIQKLLITPPKPVSVYVLVALHVDLRTFIPKASVDQ